MTDLAHPAERVTTSPSTDGLQGSARTLAVIAVSLSVLLALLDYAIANVALPDIGRDLHASASSSIWVVNAYQLASLVSLLPLASLGSKVGFSRLCRVGIMVFMVSSLLCATATSLPMLAGARVLQGIGGACIMSVNIALLRFIYPQCGNRAWHCPERRGCGCGCGAWPYGGGRYSECCFLAVVVLGQSAVGGFGAYYGVQGIAGNAPEQSEI